MRKFIIVLLAAGILMGISNIAFATAPDFVELDGFRHSRSDLSEGVFNPNAPDDPNNPLDPYAISHFFSAGKYEISVFDGAWSTSSFGGTNYDPPKWLWSMNIYQDPTNNFLLGDNNTFYDTEAQAFAANAGKSVIIDQPSDGNIWFFIDDPDSSRDNGFLTSVTAKVTVVPEPVSSVLFVLGGAIFAGRRYWNKRRKA